MRRGLWGIEGRIPDALRLFGGELAAAEDGSVCADALARAFPEREDAGVAREKCALASDRAPDGFAAKLPEAVARFHRAHRWKYRAHLDPGAQLRRPARDH